MNACSVGRSDRGGMVVLAAILLPLVACAEKHSDAPGTAAPVAPPAVSAPAPSSAPVPSALASAAPSSHDAAPRASASSVPSAAASGGQPVVFAFPEIVTLTGTLQQRPIGYSPGPVPVVVFDAPFRLESKVGAPAQTSPLPDVREAWLSYNNADKASVAKLVGKKVTFHGTVNRMETAHHHSDPWLDGKVTAR